MAIDVRRPGQYAEERVQAIVAERRRRALRDRMLWLMLGIVLVLVAFAVVAGGAAAWFSAGAATGVVAMTLAVGLLLPLGPERSWAQGADGERATADVLRALEREGWRVRHDVQTRYGNLDHVVESPAGTVFLLESKNLGGALALEDGVLTQRFEDGHAQRLGWVASRVRGQAAALAGARGANGSRPWVQGVVVLWGDFGRRPVELDRVWYVRGDDLTGWLRTRG
jgi:hypothetical protein